jgi:hypothetical protein
MVSASLSILLRATLLCVPAEEPVGDIHWVPDQSRSVRYTYLRSSQLIVVMRKTVRLAHPDPEHYLRNPDLEKCIDCHSNRVTAAVALFNAGVPIDDIAFKLRWSPESVKHYLRDCSKAIGAATARVILGHFLL